LSLDLAVSVAEAVEVVISVLALFRAFWPLVTALPAASFAVPAALLTASFAFWTASEVEPVEVPEELEFAGAGVAFLPQPPISKLARRTDANFALPYIRHLVVKTPRPHT
jgi:hypothetical protein